MTVLSYYLRAGVMALSVWVAGSAGALDHFATDWSSYVGGDWDNDIVYAVAVDGAANSYLGGALGGMLIHNNAGAEFQGNANGFVAKVSSAGSLLWAKDFSEFSNYADDVNGLYLGTQSKLAVAGRTRGSVSDEGTYAFLASVNPTDGTVDWFRTIGNYRGTNSFNAVTLDADGNSYAVGHTSLAGQICTVPGYLVNSVTYGTELKGDIDAFIVKYDPTGTVLWRLYLGGVNADSARAVAVTTNGCVYVAGQTRSSGWVTLDSGTPNPTNSAGFIVKLNTDGGHIWSSFLNGSADDAVNALRAEDTGDALFLGGVTASTNFVSAATNRNAYAGNGDGFVLKLTDTNTAFRTEWCRFTGGSAADQVSTLGRLADGRLAAGGSTGSGGWLTQTVGGEPFHGTQDGFVTFLNATNGAVSWSTYIGGAGADQVYALAAASNTFFTVGSTFSTNWVGGGFWTEWSKSDLFGGGPFAFGFVIKSEPGSPLPPVITGEPSDRSVLEGSPVTFSVTATGTAPLFYRWFRNAAPVTGLTSNSYTLAATAFDDNGALYHCVVSNGAGTAVSRSATLTVTAMGTLTVTLSPSQAIAQGARWSLNSGTTWLPSGLSTNLPVGSYSVSFQALSGWLSPATPVEVQIAHAATNAPSGVYTAIQPSADRVVAGTNVTIIVRAPAGFSTWTLVETLQAGLTPTDITAGGVWNGTARTLTFTGTAATTSTVSYAVICATSGVYTVSGIVTPLPANVPVVVTGDATIIKGNLIRTISGSSVTITVYQPSASFIWSVYESLPTGLTPANITGPSASWDPELREISWFRKGVGVTLTYEVTGEPGTYTLSGYGHVTSTDEPIFGDTELTIPGVEVPRPDILGFTPVAGTNSFTLAFTSVVNQAYVILTNAAFGVTNGWSTYLQVPGAAGTTQRDVPATGPSLFYRVRVVE